MFKELNMLNFFFTHHYKEINVREFARLNRLSPATASKYLEAFTKEKIIKKLKQINYVG